MSVLRDTSRRIQFQPSGEHLTGIGSKHHIPGATQLMVGRNRRAKKASAKASLMGNHQKCWLWGRHSVMELLRTDRWQPLELGISHSLPESLSHEVTQWAADHNCPLEVWNDSEIEARCRASDHQGLIARMPEFPYLAVDEALLAMPTNAWCTLLDGIQDPFNFGAILRSAEVLGASAAFIGTEQQCGVTAQVVRSSVGAVLHLPLAQGENVCEIARSLQARGIQLCGASEKATRSPSEIDFRLPTCLVIGNEGRGISAPLLAMCDQMIAIPQSGQVGSLNAAVAAGILYYEAGRQRRDA
jgi:23S rRNA (guanosine2251-2'-O)-methyltransferase